MPKLIVYACPVGPLAERIEQYFAASRRCCGPNAAHEYMPHISLTGFFQDDPGTVWRYREALQRALAAQHPFPPPVVTLTGPRLAPGFHRLDVRAPSLRDLAADFARRASGTTPGDVIRSKEGLHLSLAYGFPPEQEQPLSRLARRLIDTTLPVSWELRLYEHRARGAWTCHARWSLTGV